MRNNPKPLSFKNFKMKRFTLLLCLVTNFCFSQVNITTGSYYQDFGTTNITSWVNNSTFPGWYIGTGTHRGYADISGAANSFNSGGYYTYNCGGDAKIGSRGSGSATLLYYGVVLRNMTGSTIKSINVTYTGYQMSLAENGAVNTINFEYITGSTAPSITAATGTNIASLNFSQLQSNATSGSNQVNWYPCTQKRTAMSSCIPVTLANGDYILLRWKDVDDTGNDHHMAIDDVEIAFDLTGTTCAKLLPIELTYFQAGPEDEKVVLNWQTATELSNDYFVVERSEDGRNFIPIAYQKGAGNSTINNTYTTTDFEPLKGISYYRLKQTDFDGLYSYSNIETVEFKEDVDFDVFPNPTNNGLVTVKKGKAENASFTLIDDLGRGIMNVTVDKPIYTIDLNAFGKGIYFLLLNSNGKQTLKKIINQ